MTTQADIAALEAENARQAAQTAALQQQVDALSQTSQQGPAPLPLSLYTSQLPSAPVPSAPPWLRAVVGVGIVGAALVLLSEIRESVTR